MSSDRHRPTKPQKGGSKLTRPRSSKPGLDRAEQELWRRAMQGVNRLPGKERALASSKLPLPNPPAPARSQMTAAPPLSVPPTAGRAALPRLSLGDIRQIDGALATRLRRGLVPIDARIDLHGLTRSQAQQRFTHFLSGALAKEYRCLLVITGKGRHSEEGGGVLRQAVPLWLNQPAIRPSMLAFIEAQPRHGGSGALYLLLKKSRR